MIFSDVVAPGLLFVVAGLGIATRRLTLSDCTSTPSRLFIVNGRRRYWYRCPYLTHAAQWVFQEPASFRLNACGHAHKPRCRAEHASDYLFPSAEMHTGGCVPFPSAVAVCSNEQFCRPEDICAGLQWLEAPIESERSDAPAGTLRRWL